MAAVHRLAAQPAGSWIRCSAPSANQFRQLRPGTLVQPQEPR